MNSEITSASTRQFLQNHQPIYSWNLQNKIVNLYHNQIQGFVALIAGTHTPLRLEPEAVALLNTCPSSHGTERGFFDGTRISINMQDNTLNIMKHDQQTVIDDNHDKAEGSNLGTTLKTIIAQENLFTDAHAFDQLRSAFLGAGFQSTDSQHNHSQLRSLQTRFQQSLNKFQSYLTACQTTVLYLQNAGVQELEQTFQRISEEIIARKKLVHEVRLEATELETKLNICINEWLATMHTLVKKHLSEHQRQKLQDLHQTAESLFDLNQQFHAHKITFSKLEQIATQRQSNDELLLEQVTEKRKVLTDADTRMQLDRNLQNTHDMAQAAMQESNQIKVALAHTAAALENELTQTNDLQELHKQFTRSLMALTGTVKSMCMKIYPQISKKNAQDQKDILTELLKPNLTAERVNFLATKYGFKI